MKKTVISLALLATACAPAVWFVAFGVNHGWPAGRLAAFAGIGVVCGLGLIGFVGGPLFVVWRLAGAPPPRLALAPGETTLVELPANHWKGLEARSGMLSLTTRRLLFHAKRVNFQRDPYSVDLANIDGAKTDRFSRTQLIVWAGAVTERFVMRAPPGPVFQWLNVAELAQLVTTLAGAPESDRPRIVQSWRDSDA
jgi:hypothetical protein